MDTYIAFLKGINVGGKNIIKMDALRDMLERLGFENVQTYIQSGNIIFVSSKNENKLAKMIQKAIQEKFNIFIDVILRNSEEISGIIHDCPRKYKEKLEEPNPSKINKLYVGMMPRMMTQVDVKKIENYASEADGYEIIACDVYLWLENGAGSSKLAKSLSKLETPVTVRNWKTMNKLYQIVENEL